MRFRVVLLSCCLLPACDRSKPKARAIAAVVAAPAAPYDDRTRPLPERADLLVEHLAELIDRGDSVGLLPFVTPEGWNPDTAAAGAVLSDYRHHFRGLPIAGWYRVRITGDSAAVPRHLYTTLHYELLAHGSVRKTIAVTYDPAQDRLRAWDEFLLYSPRVHRYAEAVADAIRRTDAPELARLLTPDDEDFPISAAAAGIARYERELDMQTMTVRYQGLAPFRRGTRTTDVARPFGFVIEGTSGGASVSHEVLVRHGDGLIWWEDDWIRASDSTKAN